jgi:hypothetical protein
MTCLAAASMAPAFAEPLPAYTPPTDFGKNDTPPSAYFARLNRTGRWCVATPAKWMRLVDRDKVDSHEFGWVRFDDGWPIAVTYAYQSEDAYSEDRYLVGKDHRVGKMIRTGHYINDPWASVTFLPDAQGRLRLTADSKVIVRKMDAAGYDPYFVDWDHFSRLEQIPFARLLDLDHRTAGPSC